MKILSAAAAVAAVLLATQASAATVLTFDDLVRPGTGVRDLTSTGTFEYGGFVFKSTASTQGFRSFHADDLRNADPGGATIFHNWDRTWMDVTKADGSAFDLLSMDVADVRNEGLQVSNQFRFEFADGSLEFFAFTTDNLAGLQTLILDRKGLKSFGMAAPASHWWQMDNITFGSSVAAVPEPSAWAMMIMGFAGMGAMLRRRRDARSLQPA